jgi:phosphoribosylformimino-5-aminoimidazole carboxamide ribotide isomerase
MRVIPAIDVKDGKCVRLFKGDFARVTEYSDQPLEIAERFAALDVCDLHIVDLDGAKSGSPVNRRCVADIARASSFTVQVGGGIRDAATLDAWFDHGVDRCVIGSLAVEDPAAVRGLFERYGAGRLVLALDVTLADGREPMIATRGWTTTTETTLWSCIDRYLDVGLRHVLCTDIGRDGALSGPNVDLYVSILERFPGLELQASGGVRDARDLAALRDAGLPAAITGRALLDGRITPGEVASFRRSA